MSNESSKLRERINRGEPVSFGEAIQAIDACPCAKYGHPPHKPGTCPAAERFTCDCGEVYLRTARRIHKLTAAGKFDPRTEIVNDIAVIIEEELTRKESHE